LPIKLKYPFFIIVFSFLFLSNFLLVAQEKNYVSVTQETQVLRQGAKSVFKCDIFYNKEKDAIVTHNYYPNEFVRMSNRFGELKIYIPSSNSVKIVQNEFFSTSNELLYYFVNNKLSDLGLSKEGFSLANTSQDGDVSVTTWKAPLGSKLINQVKVYFREMVPIYAEYTDLGGTISKKIYYSKYEDFESFRMPTRIVEISFVGISDSTISRSVFTNIRTTERPDGEYFNFSIPENAKILK
jgi:hypothetical protein